jgi:DNA-binding transcriptional LysR family regulator
MAENWDDIRYFLAVAKAPSIKQAAVQLGTTQSAVGKRLDRLERDLNVRLFDRGPKGTHLTFQGKRLLDHALTAEAELSKAVESALGAQGRITGDCSLQMPDGVANYWIARFLPAFFTRYPNIELKMMLDNEERPGRNEIFDVHLHYLPPADADLVAKTLCTIHFMPFASRKYIEEYGAPASIGELKQHRLIDQAQYLISKGTWSSWFSDAPLKHTALFTNHSSFLARAVLSGTGIALMPSYMVLNDADYVPLDIGMRFPLRLFASYRRDLALKYPVRAAVNYLRECVFDTKAMPWFAEPFAAPERGWRDILEHAIEKGMRDAPLADVDLLAAQ